MSSADFEREASDLCDQWLDTDTPQPSSDAGTVDEQVRRRVADQQLVDALLHSLSDRDASATHHRVRRVMEAIAAEAPAVATPRRSTSIAPLVGLAACLLIAASLMVFKPASESRASDILAQLLSVSLADTDRIYHVFHSNAEQGAPFDYCGKLYLRGTTGFVLESNDFRCGRYASEYWAVPPEGPVVLADDFNWLESPSTRDALELNLLKDLSVTSHRAPLMQLSTIVELIENDYDVIVRPDTVGGFASLDELIATRRSTDEEHPASIQLWFDPQTKIVHTVELAWNVDQKDLPHHALRFTLAPTESVAEEWYQHTTHHERDRPVHRAVAKPAESNLPAKGNGST